MGTISSGHWVGNNLYKFMVNMLCEKNVCTICNILKVSILGMAYMSKSTGLIQNLETMQTMHNIFVCELICHIVQFKYFNRGPYCKIKCVRMCISQVPISNIFLYGVYEVRDTWKVRELRNGSGKVREFDDMVRDFFLKWI